MNLHLSQHRKGTYAQERGHLKDSQLHFLYFIKTVKPKYEPEARDTNPQIPYEVTRRWPPTVLYIKFNLYSGSQFEFNLSVYQIALKHF